MDQEFRDFILKNVSSLSLTIWHSCKPPNEDDTRNELSSINWKLVNKKQVWIWEINKKVFEKISHFINMILCILHILFIDVTCLWWVESTTDYFWQQGDFQCCEFSSMTFEPFEVSKHIQIFSTISCRYCSVKLTSCLIMQTYMTPSMANAPCTL